MAAVEPDDFALPVPIDTVPPEDFGPVTAGEPYVSTRTLRLYSQTRQFKHVHRLEEMCDVYRERFELDKQFAVLKKLTKLALGNGNKYKRLGPYYVTLEGLRLRLQKYGQRHRDNRIRKRWEALEQEVVEFLLELDERIQPKRKPMQGVLKPWVAEARARKKETAEAAEPEPQPEAVPEPLAARAVSELSDEELAALIPEDER